MKAEDIQEVQEFIIDLRYNKLYSIQSIMKILMDKYGLSQSSSYRHIREARKLIGEYHNKTQECVLEDAIEKLEKMLEKAKGWKAKLDIQKELNRLNQLYIQQLEITSKIEQPLFKIENNKDSD